MYIFEARHLNCYYCEENYVSSLRWIPPIQYLKAWQEKVTRKIVTSFTSLLASFPLTYDYYNDAN